MVDTEKIRMPLTSADLLGERIEALRELLPEVFTEDRIDFEKLRMVLGDTAVEPGEERYGLTWPGKAEAIRAIQTPSTGTLRPQPEESVNFDTSENLIIEGDNLEVLKLLQKSYHGKVKMIYIDPPYNTGNDYIYPDNYREGLQEYLRFSGQISENGERRSTNTESSGRHHSAWLSMMYPRLFLARNLLREDGVIFVSIDDHEVANLRLVMDEIFGAENFLDTIVWKKRYGGGAKEKYLVTLHEYVLCYARNLSIVANIQIPLSEDAIKRYYTSRDGNYERRGPYRTHPLEATRSVGRRENLIYPIPAPDGTEIWPRRQWWWDKARTMRALEKGELEFVKTADGYTVHTKQYLRGEDGEERKTKPFSVIDDVYTQHGTREIAEIFGDSTVFPFPKPTGLLQQLMAIAGVEDGDMIVDLFAGSGSLAHATLKSSVDLGITLQFVLVQIPERLEEPITLADGTHFATILDICRERVRRLIKNLYGGGRR